MYHVDQRASCYRREARLLRGRAAEMAPREPWRMVLQMDFECLGAGLGSDGQELSNRGVIEFSKYTIYGSNR